MTIIQIALRLGVLPDEIERMDSFWYNRLLFYLECETLAADLK